MKLLSPEEWAAYRGAFIALWTDATHAYALYEPGDLVAVALQEGAYPALPYLGADWFQRLAKDQNGHIATGFQAKSTAIEQFRAPDGRGPWPDFIGPEIEGAHQVALGPVYGDLTEPAHFRFFVLGSQVLNLQVRQGYAHRGILSLIRAKSPRQAARYAARISADATVAHAIAFARAAEAALEVEVPERAHFLRAVMAELERLSNHCGDLGDIAGLVGFTLLEQRFALLREYLANAAQSAFGHRLLMDVVIPGGVAKDIAEEGSEWLHDALAQLSDELPVLQNMFMNSGGLHEHLVGIGVIPASLARAYNAGGYVGRGSGQMGDARVTPGYPPYTMLELAVPMEQGGDAAARAKVRFAEMGESLRLLQGLLASLPAGSVAVSLPVQTGVGLGVAESFRGPVWYWLKIESGHIQDIAFVDASATHWSLLEKAAINTNLDDFPIIARSINPSVAGVDG